MIRTIGVDPGSRCTGYGIVEGDGFQLKYLHHGTIRLPSSRSLPERLKIIFEELNGVIGEYRPEYMAVEEVFFAKNVKSALSLGQARGVAILAGINAGLAIHEYSALRVKQSVAGYGRAGKEQVAGNDPPPVSHRRPHSPRCLGRSCCCNLPHQHAFIQYSLERSGEPMIGFLEGKLRVKSPEYVIVDVHGVGYYIHVPLSTFYDLPDQGQPVSMNIHTHVREDAIQLFGFRTSAEKEMFLLLTAVNGVGPKLALSILSGISPDELRQVVVQQDYARLKNIPGVGKKIAERVMLELRDKVKGKGKEKAEPLQPFAAGNAFSDAFSALVNLGYRPAEAEKALTRARAFLGENPSLEDLLKHALKMLA